MQEKHLAIIFGNCKANYVVEFPELSSIVRPPFDSYEKIKAHKQHVQQLELYDYWEEVMNNGDLPWNKYKVSLRDAAGSILDISEEEAYTAKEAEDEALDYWNSNLENDKMLKSVTKINSLGSIAVIAEAELVYPNWVKV